MVTSVLVAMTLLAGTVVPQGMAPDVLLTRHSYAVAQAIGSLGLDDLPTAWPLGLLLLLWVLTATGLVLRRRLESRPPTPEPMLPMKGPRQVRRIEISREEIDRRVQAWVASPTSAPGGRLDSMLGRIAGTREGGDRVIFGLWREGTWVIVLGLAALCAGVMVQRTAGLEARVVVPPATQADQGRAEVTRRDGTRWVEGEIPLTLRCADPDPADPQRRRDCQASWPGGHLETRLGSGRKVRVGGWVLTPIAESPHPSTAAPTLLLRRPGKGPEVLRGTAGHTYGLEDQSRVTLFSGPDGPLAVWKSQDKRPVLMIPSSREVPADEGGVALSGIPAWQMVVRVQAQPEALLFQVAAFLLCLGLLVLAAVPQLTIRVYHEGESVLVEVKSLNRSDLAARCLRDLEAANPPASEGVEASS